ncbi:U3 snoRNP protein [Physocladia obscura]|uniref:U3 small nucleolar RNA-associated protein 18 homolog n=1 Tax=Physocladia obscura TaxID=109957 RepID=A0AAD5TB37_9FUNG|nr:U3 snoRNP protein [Physocladia obscura]
MTTTLKLSRTPSASGSKRKKTQKLLADMQAEVAAARVRMLAKAEVDKDAEEIDLEDLVFGAKPSGVFDRLESGFNMANKRVNDDGHDVSAKDSDYEKEDDELFVIDRKRPAFKGAIIGESDDESNNGEESDHERLRNKNNQGKKEKAEFSLWEDSHDGGFEVDIISGPQRLRRLRETEEESSLSAVEYEARLRRQFVQLHPTPAWAKNPDATLAEANWEHSSTAAVLRSASSLIDRSIRKNLPSDELAMFRVKDANQTSPSAAVVQSCKFHPSAPVLLTAGWDRTLRLFHVDGKFNPKIQSVFFKDMPIHSADFTSDGKHVVVAGRRKFFYVYDVEAGQVEKISAIRGREEKSFERCIASPCGKFLAFTGRDGHIILVARHSKQWIANLKMNGSVRAIDFSKDGRWLYSIGGDGEVYQWDLNTRQCVHRFFDEGALKVNAIAVSPDNSFIATGSSAGIVNVYSASTAFESSRPTPSRVFMNLTTSISHLAFHPTSQALLFASRTKKDSMRIAHCPSLKVYPNWPTMNTPLGYVNSVDWSPGGGYLAIGNDKGKVLLYRATAFDEC